MGMGIGIEIGGVTRLLVVVPMAGRLRLGVGRPRCRLGPIIWIMMGMI